MEEFTKQLDALKTEVDSMRVSQTSITTELAIIKLQLTNHIPHTLAEQTELLKSMDSRLKPLELKQTKISGISEFLTIALKAVTMVAATVWTVQQIIQHFPH